MDAQHLSSSAEAADLRDRWRRARLSALRSNVPGATPGQDEAELLGLARDAAALERDVFEVSVLLGRSYRRFSRTDLTLTDLGRLLPLLGAPCAAEGFTRVPGEVSSRSVRPPCDTPGACAYWREALYGLVSGLSSGVRYSRVSSGTRGGACVDLLHVDPLSPHRLDPVPDALRPQLDEIAAKLGRVLPGAVVRWLGMQDGALCVETLQPTASCGLDLDQLLMGSLRRALPDLVVKNATPRPVLPDQA